MLKENRNIEELVIIFAADSPSADSLETMRNVIKQIQGFKDVKTRFLTIGIDKDIDAEAMTEIANLGSAKGNFNFIETRGKD